jgi:uncharacterized protein YjbJ (UPF0337 family)
VAAGLLGLTLRRWARPFPPFSHVASCFRAVGGGVGDTTRDDVATHDGGSPRARRVEHGTHGVWQGIRPQRSPSEIGETAADREREEHPMSIGDKIKHAAEEAVGKVKETTGNATDNESLKAEGQADQASANTKQAGDKIGDAAKNVFGS